MYHNGSHKNIVVNSVEKINDSCTAIVYGGSIIRSVIVESLNNNNARFHSDSKLMDFLPLFTSPPTTTVDDSVFVIKKQGQGEEDEAGRAQSAQSIQSRGMCLLVHFEKQRIKYL